MVEVVMQKLSGEERKQIVNVSRALWVLVTTAGRFIKNGDAQTEAVVKESFEVSQVVDDILSNE